ncbi:MAG: lysylphosphatidylglycerol synthase transmembrane domain-containing protein [bacterium]|nr:lysylphosphatidylglycerol synthase transmembrane domain-containing protein [bacterium]
MNSKSSTEPAAVSDELTTGRQSLAAFGLKSRFFFWSKIILTLLVLGLLIATIHPREILGAFNGARYPLVLAALLLVVPNLTIKTIKWGYLLRRVKPNARPLEIWNTLMIGFTFGIVTPGQLGEFGRAFFIAGRPRLELIGVSFIDKFYNLLPIILVGSLGLLLLPGLVFDGNTYLFISCCILVAILWLIFILIVLSPGWVRDLLYAVNVMLPYRDKVKVLLSGLDPIGKKQSVILSCLGFAHYGIALLQYYLLVHSFQSIHLFDSLRATAAILFVKAALPISVGGLGVGETASVGFFRLFDVQKAVAFNSSVMVFSMNILLPALIGLIILLRLRIQPENPDV